MAAAVYRWTRVALRPSGHVGRTVAHGRELVTGRGRAPRDPGDGRLGQRFGVVVDDDLPATVGGPVGRLAGRPVHGPNPRLGVDGLSADIEGPVLDGVAHARDHALAERLDVHQG